MNNEMMNCSPEMMPGVIPGMMWGIGMMGLLVTTILFLSTAALVKYLFFNKQGENHAGGSDD